MAALNGRVAFVTGSSRGIGAAIARLFAAEGAKVVVHGRDRSALAAVAAEIERAGGCVRQVTGDVTNAKALDAMRGEIERELGPVDVLVANAGGSPTQPGPFETLTEEGWRAAMDVNLTGTFLTIKTFLPGMKERQRGNIITMSSAAARRPHPQSPVPYAVAKAGIQMMTQHLAAQVGPSGIRVNCIAPETILTEKNEANIPDAQKQSLVEAASASPTGHTGRCRAHRALPRVRSIRVDHRTDHRRRRRSCDGLGQSARRDEVADEIQHSRIVRDGADLETSRDPDHSIVRHRDVPALRPLGDGGVEERCDRRIGKLVRDRLVRLEIHHGRDGALTHVDHHRTRDLAAAEARDR